MRKFNNKRFCSNERDFFDGKKKAQRTRKNLLIKRLGGVKGLLLGAAIMEPKFKSLS